jgi:hypothetical protein
MNVFGILLSRSLWSSIDPGITSDDSPWKAETNKKNIATEKIIVWLWA